MTDDFSSYPKSVAELRADRDDDGALWQPRDALISVLRMIDAQELDPDVMVIIMRPRCDQPPNVHRVCFRIAGPIDHYSTIGVIAAALQQITSP